MDESSKPSKQTLPKKNTTRKRNPKSAATKGEATKVALKGEATKVALKGEATKVALPSPENLSKLDTKGEAEPKKTAIKKPRCPTGQRRNKEGDCVEKDVKKIAKVEKEILEVPIKEQVATKKP